MSSSNSSSEHPNKRFRSDAPVLADMYEDAYTDIGIISSCDHEADKTPVKAHASVLCRIPYFKTCLQTKIGELKKENGYTVLTLKHGREVIDLCIRWIYGVDVDYYGLGGIAGDLYELAHYLGLSGLKLQIRQHVLELCDVGPYDAPLWMFVVLFEEFKEYPVSLDYRPLPEEADFMMSLVERIRGKRGSARRLLSSPQCLLVFQSVTPECLQALAYCLCT